MEYEKEYILILLTPQGGKAEGRAPLVLSISLEYIPSQIPYILSINGVESKMGFNPHFN